MPLPSSQTPHPLRAILLDCEIAQERAPALLVMHEANGSDKRLDHVDLLQRGRDQELQTHLLKKLETVARRIVRAAPERLVDDDEMESARAFSAPFETKLIGEAGSQNRVSELFLLATRFAARVGVMLVFAAVRAPALGRRKDKPVAHIGNFSSPSLVVVGRSIAAAEALDYLCHLDELRFGIGAVLGAR